MAVNSTEDGIEWTTPASGGTTYTAGDGIAIETDTDTGNTLIINTAPGVEYQAGDGLKIEEDTDTGAKIIVPSVADGLAIETNADTGEAAIVPHLGNGLQFNSNENVIEVNDRVVVLKTDLDKALNNKQDTLTAGNNINISRENEISLADNVVIDNGVGNTTTTTQDGVSVEYDNDRGIVRNSSMGTFGFSAYKDENYTENNTEYRGSTGFDLNSEDDGNGVLSFSKYKEDTTNGSTEIDKYLNIKPNRDYDGLIMQVQDSVNGVDDEYTLATTDYVDDAVAGAGGGSGTTYTAGDAIDIDQGAINVLVDGTTIDLDSNNQLMISNNVATKAYVDKGLNSKQGILTAGNGIAITTDGNINIKLGKSNSGLVFDSNGYLYANVGSATYEAGNGISIYTGGGNTVIENTKPYDIDYLSSDMVSAVGFGIDYVGFASFDEFTGSDSLVGDELVDDSYPELRLMVYKDEDRNIIQYSGPLEFVEESTDKEGHTYYE